MYYDIAAAIIVALSISLIFFIDTIIDQNTTNKTLVFIRENNVLIGLVGVGLAYYVYTLSEHEDTYDSTNISSDLTSSNISTPKMRLSKKFKPTSSTEEVLNL